MRNCVIAGAATLVVMGIVVGCGAFGSKDDAAIDSTPTPPPEDAAVNAVPPVTGEPLTGVFVSSSKGSDNTLYGTADLPWKTLAAAMKDAKAKSLRVIACAEDYPEAVTAIDGVSVYGGYDCSTDDWSMTTTRSTVHSPTSPALLAKSITLDTRFDGFEFYSPDFGGEIPSETAASSVGIEIHDSVKLTIANALVHPGAGAPGKDGTEGSANTETLSPTGGSARAPGGSNLCPFIAGCNLGQTEYGGGSGGRSACALGVSGGPGGHGGASAFWRGPSCTIIPVADAYGSPATATTVAGSVDWCTDYNTGVIKFQYGAGKLAPPAADGPDGSNGAWTLTTAGFVPGHGTAGGNGSPGMGGGGGGGTYGSGPVCNACPEGIMTAYNWSGAGAGGGAGGCPGLAGTPGFGGGASIGAFVTMSNVTFSNVTLESGAGGNGGKGTLGSAGLAGGTGGPAADHGGPGGSGGHGGYGGLSGNGAPGPSIALAYTGTRPVTSDGTVLQPGNGGAQLPALTKTANQGTKSLPAIAGESIMERVF